MRWRFSRFIILAAFTMSATASAQSVQERCAALLAEMTAADDQVRKETHTWETFIDALNTAARRLQALEGTAGTPVSALLLEEEPYSTGGMLQFREQFALPAELNGYATSVRPEAFWRHARDELRRRAAREDGTLQIRRASARFGEASDQYHSLNCESLSSKRSGPLPVDRRPDGQPIVTDALITRWIKARYAQAVTGGAYWQAGQMTTQDFINVGQRMQSYMDLMRSGRQAEQFSDEEVRAINARWPDIRNTFEGNWSQIQLR